MVIFSTTFAGIGGSEEDSSSGAPFGGLLWLAGLAFSPSRIICASASAVMIALELGVLVLVLVVAVALAVPLVNTGTAANDAAGGIVPAGDDVGSV